MPAERRSSITKSLLLVLVVVLVIFSGLVFFYYHKTGKFPRFSFQELTTDKSSVFTNEVSTPSDSLSKEQLQPFADSPTSLSEEDYKKLVEVLSGSYRGIFVSLEEDIITLQIEGKDGSSQNYGFRVVPQSRITCISNAPAGGADMPDSSYAVLDFSNASPEVLEELFPTGAYTYEKLLEVLSNTEPGSVLRVSVGAIANETVSGIQVLYVYKDDCETFYGELYE